MTPNCLWLDVVAHILPCSEGNWPWVSRALLAIRRADRRGERETHCRAIGNYALMGHSAIAVICRLPDSGAGHFSALEQVI
jgi:hypothetical protein